MGDNTSETMAVQVSSSESAVTRGQGCKNNSSVVLCVTGYMCYGCVLKRTPCIITTQSLKKIICIN